MPTENTNAAFVKVKPIDELANVTTLEPGVFLFKKNGEKEMKTIDANLFYQLLHNFAKPITPTDAGPFSANQWYKPTITSQSPGTNYPNAGNLKAIDGYDTLFFYNGTNWTKTETYIAPELKIVIPSFENSTFPITGQTQRIYNGVVWEIGSGVSADASELPGTSVKWKEVLRTNPTQAPTGINNESLGVDLSGNLTDILNGAYGHSFYTKGKGTITSIDFSSVFEGTVVFILAKKLTPGDVTTNTSFKIIATSYVLAKIGNNNTIVNWPCEKDYTVFIQMGGKQMTFNTTATTSKRFNFATGVNLMPLTDTEVKPVSVGNGYWPYKVNVTYFRDGYIPVPPVKNHDSNYNVYTGRGGFVSFIDDDSQTAFFETLHPYFKYHGIPHSTAVIKTEVINNNYVKALQSMARYEKDIVEIMTHTVSHLGTMQSMSESQLIAEIDGCRDWLLSLGADVFGYVSPQGKFNDLILRVASRNHKMHYRFDYTTEMNKFDQFYNFGIKRINFGSSWAGFPSGLTGDQVNLLIQQAVASNSWLVITTHAGNGQIGGWKDELDKIVAYIKANNVRVLLPADGFDVMKNIIEVENGFRITKTGATVTTPIDYEQQKVTVV